MKNNSSHNRNNFIINLHNHHDHVHFNLLDLQSVKRKTSKISQKQEGCPCCAVGIDLDEVATVFAKLKNGDDNNHGFDFMEQKKSK